MRFYKKIMNEKLFSDKETGVNAVISLCLPQDRAMRKPAQCPQQPSICLEGAFMAWPVTPS